MKQNVVRKSVCMMMVMVLVLAICPVHVSAKVKVSKGKASLYVGETLSLKLSGAKGKVTWKSSKKSVAAVDKKTGVVTAKKKGNANITATSAGKKYTCKVKVSKLPKNYATINGKRVKVGKSVTVTYKLQSAKKICNVGVHMKYDKKAMKIMSSEEDRFKIWLCNTMIEDYKDGNKTYDLYELVSVDPNATEFVYKDVDCKKAKVVDTFKVKALKHGNYVINTEYSYLNSEGQSVGKKDCTVTVTVK